MISAQNHQRLLNGNKYIAFLLLASALVSCGALRKVKIEEAPPEEVVIVPEKVDPPKEEEGEKPKEEVEEKVEKLTYTKVTFQGMTFDKVPVHENSFSIAVLLPFHAGVKSTTSDRARSNYMLEYYQGMQLAFDELKTIGSFYKVHIFDTKNDTTEVKRILADSKVKNADLIIGPTDEEQLRIAAYFAKTNKIPLFSPISIIDKPWSDNPYLYNLTPSYKMQAKAFVAFYLKEHKEKPLVLLRDGGKWDRTFGAALKEELANSKVNHNVVPFSAYQKWSDLIGSEEAVVLHTSTSKTNMTYTVNSLLSKSGKVTLMAPDKWMEFTSVDYSFWERLNVQFITTDLALAKNDDQKRAMQLFRYRYNGDPTEFAFKGYDHMLFAGQVLHAFGKYFPLFVTEKRFDYSNTAFNLTKEDNCFHNRYIHIIGFEDRKIAPVIAE